MKRLMMIVAGVLLWCGGQRAEAQIGYQQPQVSPFNRPTVSPYLNMFRGGNSAVNLYALVRPQQQVSSFIGQQQAFQQQETSAINSLTQNMSQPLPTGTSARFMTYTQYFMTVNGPRATPGGMGQTMSAPPPPSVGFGIATRR